MNSFLDWMQHSAVQRIGWTLLHFLWQGTAIAWLAAIGLALLRRRSAAGRYTLCCVAMAAMAIAPVATGLLFHPSPVQAAAKLPTPATPPVTPGTSVISADATLPPPQAIQPGAPRI